MGSRTQSTWETVTFGHCSWILASPHNVISNGCRASQVLGSSFHPFQGWVQNQSQIGLGRGRSGAQAHKPTRGWCRHDVAEHDMEALRPGHPEMVGVPT